MFNNIDHTKYYTGTVREHTISVTGLSLFIQILVPNLESERSCISGIVLMLFLPLYFRNVPTL